MRLKELRLKNNLTQEDIAKKINKSAVAYGYYESGRNEPDLKTLLTLADFYHVTIDYLVEHEVPYLIDKSAWPECKRELLNMIAELDDFESEKIKGIIVGYTQAQKEKPKIIN